MKERNRAFLVIATILLLTGYFLSAFLKISASITMPMFQQRLGMSSSAVGVISSMFFATYAVMQVFGSMLCVRFGSLRIMTVGMLLSAGGTLCFSIGSSPALILAGRFLMGLGIGPAFVSVIAFLQENFEGRSYTLWAGFSVMVCNLGSACSSGPLNQVLRILGTTVFFRLLTYFQIAIAVFMACSSMIHTKNAEENRKIGHQVHFKHVLGMIFGSRTLIGCLIIWISYNALLVAYHGLWCVKWTLEAFPGQDLLSSYSGTIIGIGIMVGCLLCDRVGFSSKGMANELRIHVCLQIAVFGLLIVIKNMASTTFFLFADLAIDLLYGLSVGMVCVLITALVRENSDSSHNAVIMGVLNGLANIGSLLFQSLSGVLIDFFTPITSYAASFTFSFIAIGTVFSIAMIVGSSFLKGQRRK